MRRKCYSCGKEMKRYSEGYIEACPYPIRNEYPYPESGLDNVFLVGVPVYKCECGEEIVEIPQMAELHEALGREIVNKKGRLTGREARYLRKSLGFSAKDFAAKLGISVAQISRWENEKDDIGPANDALIRLVYKIMMGHEDLREAVQKLEELHLRERPQKYLLKIYLRRRRGTGYTAQYDFSRPAVTSGR